ncbi:MAG TPA: transcriptional regulator [Stellaceae bacterium]|nr:transcriptional regulator [Stellaceae bacterium]
MIKSEQDHMEALAEIDRLMGSPPGSPESERVAILATLVEKYEDELGPFPLPDPVEAIKFIMEQRGITRADLRLALGSDSRVSEILNRKRPLTLPMIRSLNEQFHIPAEILIREYQAAE